MMRDRVARDAARNWSSSFALLDGKLFEVDADQVVPSQHFRHIHGNSLTLLVNNHQ